MYPHKHLYLFPLLSLLLIPLLSVSAKGGLKIERHEEGQKKVNIGPSKLFVFGDSYVDTGNSRKGQSSAWKAPYGTTFPGKPAGRFSDGRVLTDYIAKYLGLKSPVPYRMRKGMARNMKYGVNFGFGGAGVFDTYAASPNVSTQIQYLERLIQTRVYSTSDITNSVALVSVAGNDYAHYVATNASLQDLASFIGSVVKQIKTDLIRIHKLGVKKIAVNNLEPLGCLPIATASSSFRRCNPAFNAVATLHNDLLKQYLLPLNRRHQTFLILDFYKSFTSVLNHPSAHKIHNPFVPCCVGVNSKYSCGSVDETNKYYRVCDDPNSAFFWDSLHPSQAGWYALYNYLRAMPALQQLPTFH